MEFERRVGVAGRSAKETVYAVVQPGSRVGMASPLNTCQEHVVRFVPVRLRAPVCASFRNCYADSMRCVWSVSEVVFAVIWTFESEGVLICCMVTAGHLAERQHKMLGVVAKTLRD